jgi:Tfp pilus assembly protein PilF
MLAVGATCLAATCPRAAAAQSPRLTARGAQAAQAVAEGEAALARGEEAAARLAFERALAVEPDNVAAHTYLGVLADRAGDLASAERHFAAAARAAPRLPSALNNYGAILTRLGRTEQARAQFEASLKLDERQPNALVNLAQIRFAAGQPEDLRAARDLFARADAIAPDAELARALVVIALKLGDRASAATAYRAYAARLKDAPTATLSTTPTEPTPTTPAARAELGAALLEADLLDEATAELNAALAVEPNNVAAVVALARAQLRRRDVPGAGRTLEAAVARGLDAAPVYAALAEVYAAGGYVENAIPAMRLAVERDPRNEAYHYRYALLLIDTRAPAAAVIRMKEALKTLPASARVWLALGIAQLTEGSHADAEQSLRRALELDPRAVPALAYLGATAGLRGQYAQAVAYYERAIAVDDRTAALYFLAADALLKLTEVDAPRVEKYLARANELDPALAPARLALGKLYMRAERWADAAAQLEQAARLAPELSEAHYQLGRAYTRLKRKDDAQRELALFKQQSEAARVREETQALDLVRRLANVRF